MAADLLTRDLDERRRTAAGLAGGLVVLAAAALAISVQLEDSIAALTNGFPAALTAFIPAGVPGGYVVGEVFNLIAPVALVGYAVVTGAAAVAGEETAGTMSMLIAQPVSRRAVVGWKAAGLGATLMLVIGVFGAAVAVTSAVSGIGLTAANVAATCLHLFLLAGFFGLLALALGATTGHVSLAAGAAGATALVSYVANAMLPLAGMAGWARLSPWHYYAANIPLSNGVDPANLAVLIVMSGLALGAAVIGFSRRDLRG